MTLLGYVTPILPSCHFAFGAEKLPRLYHACGMQSRSKRPHDPNQSGKLIVDLSVEETDDSRIYLTKAEKILLP